MIVQRILLISAGAALGANARYLFTIWAEERFGVDFPYGTLLVNVTGSLFLGLVLELVVLNVVASPEMRLLVTTGFLGSYTTFSTYTVESLALISEGEIGIGLLYIGSNVVLGLLFALLGLYLARLIVA